MKDTEKCKRTTKRERRVSVSLLERIQPDAAGIDCRRGAALLPSRPAVTPSQVEISRAHRQRASAEPSLRAGDSQHIGVPSTAFLTSLSC